MGDVIGMAERLEDLTRREHEVLALMAYGLSNAAICERLVISPKTLERHVQQVYAKLGMSLGDGFHRRVRAVLVWHAADAAAVAA